MKSGVRPHNLIIIAVILSMVVYCMPVNASSSYLDDIEQQQQQTQDQIDSVENSKKQAEDQVNSLNDEKDQLQNQLNDTTSKLDSVNAEIDSAKNSIASTSAEIISLSEELEQAKADEEEQYQLMKLHIKYMYENQSRLSILAYLLSATSIRDFITKAEYMTAIMENDDKVLNAYVELQDTIASKSSELEEKQEELNGYQATLTDKQTELYYIAAGTSDSIDEKNSDISEAQAAVDSYEAELAALQVKKAALDSQAAEAQAAIAQAIEAKMEAAIAAGLIEDTSGSIVYSSSDLDLIAATIEAEAGGESYVGQLAVGTVIVNRVLSSYFPNTVTGVITQDKQFSSYKSGMVAKILERGPSATCIQAATEVLNGYRAGNWLFFMTKSCADSYGITGYTEIGNHVFFYKWGAN